MIKDIVETFYDLAKQHKLIRSFKYEQLSKSAGTGEDKYPLFFLEDPIYINDGTTTGGTNYANINFDIVMTPQWSENYNLKPTSELDCQNIAESIALNCIAKLRNDINDDKISSILSIVSWDFVTLRRWYDDAASGVRVSLKVSIPNDIHYCDLEEHFDENKEFKGNNLLSDIPTDDADGCISFDYKLPKISLD